MNLISIGVLVLISVIGMGIVYTLGLLLLTYTVQHQPSSGPGLPIGRKQKDLTLERVEPLTCPVCFCRTKRGHEEYIQGHLREENFSCTLGHYDYQYLEGDELERIGDDEVFSFDEKFTKKRAKAIKKARKDFLQ